ncbi:type II secretion system protein [Chitinibacter sp. S2-10]|uniref:type II secretion system protein n=1 Tax=Chitinibacter sp. S2-10 TaxID=3373597 RepID=UPI0039777786
MRQRGFSLIELLLVITIMAALASLALVNSSNIQSDGNEQLSTVQMNEVASALQRFHRDIGYWPGESGGPAELASQLSPIHAADLGLLIKQPTTCTGICIWDSNAQRGWHGPYLQPNGIGWLRIGLQTMQGVSAGKEYQASTSDTYQWYVSKASATIGTSEGRINKGRPILFYPPDNNCPARTNGECPARLIAAGADGDFGTDPKIIDANCRPSDDTGAYKDNLVLCL